MTAHSTMKLDGKLNGLVAATHTPFTASGELNLPNIEPQAAHLERTGVMAVFIGGSTGESHSLTVVERLALAQRWSEVVRGSKLKLIVHVGGNCLADAKALAAQAQSIGAVAVAALAPSYFKPKSLDTLIACCREVAAASPALPFYFYDIPSMTGVHLPMPAFLEQASKQIPTLTGIKFSNPDLLAYQQCLAVQNGRFDMPWGTDEYLLAAMAVGAVGGVGSTYNFAAPIYTRLIAAFKKGDLATAQMEQRRSAQVVDLLLGYGYMGAAKAVMGMLGVDVGPARLPHTNLSSAQTSQLRADLERLGFFDWVKV